MNPFDMLKNAGELQKQMKSMQDKVLLIQEIGSSGGGMVTVTMNGKMEVVSINISKEVVDPNDIRMLEDLVKAALNDAQNRVKESISKEMGLLAGLGNGLNIPGFM